MGHVGAVEERAPELSGYAIVIEPEDLTARNDKLPKRTAHGEDDHAPFDNLGRHAIITRRDDAVAVRADAIARIDGARARRARVMHDVDIDRDLFVSRIRFRGSGRPERSN